MIISEGELAKMPDQEEHSLRGVEGHHCLGAGELPGTVFSGGTEAT